MVKKLEIKAVPVPNNPAIVKQVGIDNESLFNKINELVDAVNELQATISKMENVAENNQSAKITQGFKNLHDPYAEQRGWVGKLCRAFDDDETTATVFGILEKIIGPANPYLVNGAFYEHCEPVKPDDDIIYKGE